MRWILGLNAKLVGMFFLGLASGLPFALSTSTLAVWLAQIGISKSIIGLFGILSSPYSFKFLWAPIVDNLSIPLLSKKIGKRRSWILSSQIFLAIFIIALGSCNPVTNIKLMAFFTFLVSFAAATQDIIIDTYRIEMAPEEKEQSIVVSITIVGYRVGYLISGGGVLLLVDMLCNNFDLCNNFVGWKIAYAVIAFIPLVGAVASFFMGEPYQDNISIEKNQEFTFVQSLKKSVIDPFIDFMKRENWVLVLIFTTTYRACDAFIATMIQPFFMELGFTLTQIGLVVKTFGFFATIFGGFLGTYIVFKSSSIKTALFIVGLGQMLSNVTFIIQSYMGNSLEFLYVSVATENICSGAASAVFIVYLSSLCSRSFTATQYALLSALASVDKTFISAFSGWIAQNLGWVHMFGTSIIIGIPPLIILHFISCPKKSNIRKPDSLYEI